MCDVTSIVNKASKAVFSSERYVNYNIYEISDVSNNIITASKYLNSYHLNFKKNPHCHRQINIAGKIFFCEVRELRTKLDRNKRIPPWRTHDGGLRVCMRQAHTSNRVGGGLSIPLAREGYAWPVSSGSGLQFPSRN